MKTVKDDSMTAVKFVEMDVPYDGKFRNNVKQYRVTNETDIMIIQYK